MTLSEVGTYIHIYVSIHMSIDAIICIYIYIERDCPHTPPNANNFKNFKYIC